MTIDFVSGKPILTLELNETEDAKMMFDELHQCEKLDIKISKYRNKKSREANSYFWVLCGKLASCLKQNKIDIYRSLVRGIGDNFEIYPVKTERLDKVIWLWQSRGLGWICDIVGDSKHEGYTNVCFYQGCSTYDSKQMSDLIDAVVFECKEQGIQTETPEKIEEMLRLWEQAERQGK